MAELAQFNLTSLKGTRQDVQTGGGTDVGWGADLSGEPGVANGTENGKLKNSIHENRVWNRLLKKLKILSVYSA